MKKTQLDPKNQSAICLFWTAYNFFEQRYKVQQ